MGMYGLDIEAHGRAMHRYLKDGQLSAYTKQPTKMKRTYGVGKRTLAKKCALKAGLPQYGVVGPALYWAMQDANAYDVLANHMIDVYIAASKKPILVEPRQGWESLAKVLWPAYSEAMLTAGMSDLGTYNPYSRLPSGKPSAHASWPARAFDVGIEPDTGWANLPARTLAQSLARRPEIVQVILGNEIYTTARGWHSWNGGGHQNHIHVQGY